MSSTRASEQSRGFSFEVLLSAGPRKNPEDYEGGLYRELGEDAAGVVALPGMTLFWLADGTGDESVLPGFSARILAQDAGTTFAECARRLCRTTGVEFEFSLLVRATLDSLAALWRTRLEERWRNLRQRGEETSLLRSFDLCGDGWRRKSWSSTLVAGRVKHQSGLLEAINLGDGGFLVEEQGADVRMLDRSVGRLWICLEHPSGDQQSAERDAPPSIKMQPDPMQDVDVLRFENVRWVLCMSDGVGAGPIEPIVKTRHGGIESLAALFKRLRQKTYDDQTLILGRRLDLDEP